MKVVIVVQTHDKIECIEALKDATRSVYEGWDKNNHQTTKYHPETEQKLWSITFERGE